jgi:2-polyprenyl-6-methoxyphenol hydroxylase-like FAD-dependent oxidoreductase
LIVGAGPSGLVTAIELAQRGLPFRLIDKSEQPAQWSQALVVQARSLEQFERYGIADAAVQNGVKLRRMHIFSEKRSNFVFGLDHIPSRYPFVLFLPQNQTEAMLTQHLHELGGDIERGTELVFLEDRDDGATVGLRRRDGSIEQLDARWVIGCDGAHSVVREKLKIPFIGEKLSLSFFLGDLQLEGPDVPDDELRIYLHHGDLVFIGRLSDKLHRVIVALNERQHGDEPDEQFGVDGFQRVIDQAGARMRVVDSAWMTPFRVNDRQAERYRGRSSFLVGDAAHVHSPVGGQGMNTGMQDAANLAWKLAAVTYGAPPQLLDSYDEERSAVGRRLLRTTKTSLSAATVGNAIFEKLRDTVLSLAAHSNHLKQVLAGFISETDINYRESSIVTELEGEGQLKAGDRVPNPDVLFPSGQRGRLLDPLQSGNHLVITVEPISPDGLDTRLSRVSVVTASDETGTGPSFVPTKEIRELFGLNRVAIVRPDGYLGFRGSADEWEPIEQYARVVGLV